MHLPRHPDPLLPIDPLLPRRHWLGRALGMLSAAALAGCASPWPPVPAGSGSSSARQRLRECAEAHGSAAWGALRDVNLAVAGLTGLAVPPIDGAGAAQVRWLPSAGVMAWQTTDTTDTTDTTGQVSPAVHWRRWGAQPEQRAWRGALPLTDSATLAAAAGQAELLRLWWLGPVAAMDRPGALNWAEPETLDGRRCDHLHLSGLPGQAGAVAGPLSLFIDREQGWLRRLRVPIEGGARPGVSVAELDLADHRRLQGVLWPLRCRLNRPSVRVGSPPQVWRLGGLDVNRGYPAADLAAAAWSGAAAAPAGPLPPG